MSWYTDERRARWNREQKEREAEDRQKRIDLHRFLMRAARRLQRRATKPERALKQAFTDLGIRFKFQIVCQFWEFGAVFDFKLHARVVVEIDGENHDSDHEQRVRDFLRDKATERRGFHLIRFTNEETLRDPYGVAFQCIAFMHEWGWDPLTDPELIDGGIWGPTAAAA